MRITVAAPAKVNLWLRVGAPEESGYHPLRTLFCGLQLADTVVLRAAGEDRDLLEVGAAPPLRAVPEMGPAESNLAVRAARAFTEAAGLDELPRIRLVKRVPAAGGLGGGSTDAAAVLRAMERMHPRTLAREDLLRIARGLGSDVPFFLLGSPLALGSGRGDVLTACAPLPARAVVLVLPPFGVDTAEAYRWLDQEDRGTGAVGPTGPEEAAPESWAEVETRAANDFEGPVFRRRPRLREVRDALREAGAGIALLAGSGSTVFGVFDGRPDADRAARGLRNRFGDCRVLVTNTRAR